jgi:hypothetical protein
LLQLRKAYYIFEESLKNIIGTTVQQLAGWVAEVPYCPHCPVRGA